MCRTLWLAFLFRFACAYVSMEVVRFRFLIEIEWQTSVADGRELKLRAARR